MSPSRILGVFFRYFYVARKGLYSLSDLFYWPFVDILLWGLTSTWMAKQGCSSDLPLILMTGLIFWQIVWRGAQDISVNLLQDFWQRNLVNLFSTPLTLIEWITGMLLLGLCKLLVAISFAGLLIFILYELNVFLIGWVFLPFAVLLVIFGWTVSFISSSAIILWGHRVEMFAWMIGFIFAPFSAVFYPIDILPSWAQTIGWCLPTTYIFEGMRCALFSGSCPFPYFWISLGLNLVYLIGAIILFAFAFQKSKEKGFARLE
ncbi:MAG: ABC transporter permease [Chlamydiae bacterium]|nr:ABC transporter permease [Chlamydiota bacterium]